MRKFPIRPPELWGTLKDIIKEILIVAVGVGITFYVSSIIESRQRKSDIIVTLELVKKELELNRTIANNSLNTINDNIESFTFLHKNEKNINTLDSDTLLHHLSGTLSYEKDNMHNYALDVLKVNARYKELNNELLIYLSTIYGNCDTYLKERNHYFENIFEVFEESNRQLFLIKKAHKKRINGQIIYEILMGIPHYRALYANSTVSSSLRELTKETIEEIDQCINKLDSIIQFDGYENFELPQR